MPIDTMRDAFVSVNAVDLSDHVESVTVTYSRAVKEANVMGTGGVLRKAGLYDWSIKIDFRQDFSAGKVDATLFPLLGVQTAIKVRPLKATVVGPTNPEYQGNGMTGEIPVLSGEVVGEVSNCSVTFVGSDGIPLIRAVA